MGNTKNLDWLWLTKRPWNMVKYLEQNKTPANFWAGTTVENQKAADERIPHLLKCKDARIRFLSMEPLLEMVLFQREWVDRYCYYPSGSRSRHARTGGVPGNFEGTVNWIIVGAESLNKRPGRPMEHEWLVTYDKLCARFGIPYFVKQGDVGGVISDAYTVEGKTYKEIPSYFGE